MDMTYVFKLRRGVRWHAKPPVNGRELTAEDVVYNVERFRTIKGNANASMLNLAARLNDVAGCDEVVVSNTLYQRLPDAARAEFLELAPVEAKNIGRIRAWRRGPPRAPLA